jgi:CBS domain-containing protein
MNRSIIEIYTRNPHTLPPETPLKVAVSKMEIHRISCLLIVEDGKPLGIYTEKDLGYILNEQVDLSELTIGDKMSGPVLTAETHISVFEAAYMMTINQAGHLVITDNEGLVDGIVTQTDIVNYPGLNYFTRAKTVDSLMIKRILTRKNENSLREAIEAMVHASVGCVISEEKPAGCRHFKRGGSGRPLAVRSVNRSPSSWRCGEYASPDRFS